MLLVCEATRRHVTVALVGDGGDEAFGGYERYRAHALAGRVPRFAGRARRRGARRRSRRRGASRARRSSARGASSTSPPSRRRRGTRASSRSSRSSCAARSGPTRPARTRRETLLPHDPDLRIVDIESYLPGDLLPKSDIASMAVSLELRSPFLDHHVIELGLALPPELARGKAALKQAFAADLPPEIAARGKTGFGVPLDGWFRGRAPRDRGRAAARRRRPRPLPRGRSSSGSSREHATRAPTTATGSGASACSSSGSAATSTARRLEVAQHREHAAVVALGRRQAELGEDRADVLLDRPAR